MWHNNCIKPKIKVMDGLKMLINKNYDKIGDVFIPQTNSCRFCNIIGISLKPLLFNWDEWLSLEVNKYLSKF